MAKLDKYQKLGQDLIAAVEAAKRVAPGDDGGTCNLDAVTLCLPRWREEKIQAAAQAAGISCYDLAYGRQKVYVFSPPFPGQADARARQVKAMCAVLAAAGYHASIFYRVD